MPDQYNASKKSRIDQLIDPAYTQAQLDEIYTRSVNSFFCPVCSMGRCRVIIKSQSKPYTEWLYECDKCSRRGTKENLYCRVNCNICGRVLNEWGRCPTGCLDNSISTAIIAAYARPQPQIQPIVRCPECFCEVGACEHTAPIESMSAEHILHGEA